MSEVGFEPGTFRSCVEHSNHYATDTPPIPDVLIVLVSPKHIHRNVTTTLQSRFTPTAPPHRPPRTLRRPSPISTVVHLALPPRPVADLGVNVSDNIRCDVINSYLLTWRIWGILSATYILLSFASGRHRASLGRVVNSIASLKAEVGPWVVSKACPSRFFFLSF